MEIILLQKINKLGNIGDAVEVRPGFGRNFLIPTGKALRATKENKELFEKTKAKLLKENNEAIQKAEKIRAEVENLKLVIVRSASDTGILYGSVTTRDISNLIAENGIKLSRKQVALDKPIKELGIFDMSVIDMGNITPIQTSERCMCVMVCRLPRKHYTNTIFKD